VDRDRLQPSRSAPPDPPQGEQVQPRPFGLADRSGVNPALTPHAETLRSADRPLRVVPAPPSSVPPGKGPPLPGRGASGTGQPSPERLRRELEVTREEIRHLHEMTLELPEIFENKFRQRLRETRRQQRLMLEENAYLKRKLLELGPATSPRLRPPLLLQPAQTKPAQTKSANPLERQARPGLMQSLRQAWGGLARGRARATLTSATLKGDEPTRDGLADPIHK
jgi:hypothetical protein